MEPNGRPAKQPGMARFETFLSFASYMQSGRFRQNPTFSTRSSVPFRRYARIVVLLSSSPRP
jgi:hypothetical protein